MAETSIGNGCNNSQSENNKNHATEIMLFLGAGASLPAGITGVEGMVNKLIKDLQKISYGEYLKIVTEVTEFLRNWVKGKEDKKVDIELLLETIEKMENINNDVISLLFEKKATFLNRFENVIAKNGQGILLSTMA
ncbi:MAG: hypothetical protein GEU26_17875 [Nitrososphaeraceae archaeon]|nr:hypothetical protein [Nitrososphaeraceae archaeon]